MTSTLQAQVSRLLMHLVWVSLGCSLLFVAERFAYNVLGIGVAYHKLPTMFLWLLLLPWLGYWRVLFRSPFLGSRRRPVRVGVFGLVALVLAFGWFNVSIGVFWSVASSRGVQFW
jgi:hypothetical protein